MSEALIGSGIKTFTAANIAPTLMSAEILTPALLFGAGFPEISTSAGVTG